MNRPIEPGKVHGSTAFVISGVDVDTHVENLVEHFRIPIVACRKHQYGPAIPFGGVGISTLLEKKLGDLGIRILRCCDHHRTEAVTGAQVHASSTLYEQSGDFHRRVVPDCSYEDGPPLIIAGFQFRSLLDQKANVFQ